MAGAIGYNLSNYSDPHKYLLRGYNKISSIHGNILLYTLEKEEDGGLPLEVSQTPGDSGSGVMIATSDGLYIVGVVSTGELGTGWGSKHGLVRVGGYHK